MTGLANAETANAIPHTADSKVVFIDFLLGVVVREVFNQRGLESVALFGVASGDRLVVKINIAGQDVAETIEDNLIDVRGFGHSTRSRRLTWQSSVCVRQYEPLSASAAHCT